MELSKEVFRLKEALGALSPPLGLSSSHSSSHSHSERVPPVNPGQQVALQNRVAVLSKELQVRASLSQNKYRGSWFKECWSILSVLYILLQDWERKHRQVVAVYRSHLLAAVQVSTTLCTFVEDTSLSGQCNMKCCWGDVKETCCIFLRAGWMRRSKSSYCRSWGCHTRTRVTDPHRQCTPCAMQDTTGYGTHHCTIPSTNYSICTHLLKATGLFCIQYV